MFITKIDESHTNPKNLWQMVNDIANNDIKQRERRNSKKFQPDWGRI